MRIYEYDTWYTYASGCVQRLSECPISVTVEPGDVYLVVLFPNKNLYNKGGITLTAGPQGTILLVDRVYIHHGEIYNAGGIRQAVDITWADEPKYRDMPITDIFYRGSEKSNKYLRRVCEERGALLEVVPAEITPICRPFEVLVNAFNMSGTKYYRVPARVYEELTRPKK